MLFFQSCINIYTSKGCWVILRFLSVITSQLFFMEIPKIDLVTQQFVYNLANIQLFITSQHHYNYFSDPFLQAVKFWASLNKTRCSFSILIAPNNLILLSKKKENKNFAVVLLSCCNFDTSLLAKQT